MNNPSFPLSPTAQTFFQMAADHCFRNRTVRFSNLNEANNVQFGENYTSFNPPITCFQQIIDAFDELVRANAITDYQINRSDDGDIADITYIC